MFLLSDQKKKRNIVKPEKEKRNIVKPVEGDDIQVSIVGASDDVPWRQSSCVFLTQLSLVALCCPVQSGSQNKVVRVDSPDGLDNSSVVAD